MRDADLAATGRLNDQREQRLVHLRQVGAFVRSVYGLTAGDNPFAARAQPAAQA